jgi:two-component system, NtrC family, response regulator AtoC
MAKKTRILVVDDELAVRDSLSEWLREDGYEVSMAGSGPEAIELVKRHNSNIVLLDLKMPGMDGIETLKRVKEISSDTEIIMVTAYATVDTAVEAMRQGAYDYLVKPVDPEELDLQIKKIVSHQNLVLENVLLRQKLEAGFEDEIVGKSEPMQRVYEFISRVAVTASTVLITGESGTGKELVARAIHANSDRAYMPMITVSCGALPETLLESELFGFEKGAFTGADYTKKGRFELANGGTLFLDEIGDISPKTQVDLLRVLQHKELHRIGAKDSIKVDVRIVAATNRDLRKAIADGRFREDLYYRLNVLHINLPPLRERKEDIPLLAEHFVRRLAVEMNMERKVLSQDTLKQLIEYSWPGNVRELENVLERAMVIGRSFEIQPEDLPFCLPDIQPVGLPRSLKELERVHITKVLEQNHWNITQSAKELEIDRQTLYNKIQKYDLQKTAS